MFFIACKEKNKITTKIVNHPLSADPSFSNLMPIIDMKEESYNFGDVMEGELLTHTFTVKNIGNEMLIISDAKGSCGCTVSEWPRTPIRPGEESYVRVTFNSSGREGQQKKTLITNTVPNIKVITIQANIIKSNKN